VEDKVAI